MEKIDVSITKEENDELMARENTVQCAIQFMQSLLLWKGADKGLEIWETMFEQMPEFSEIKADVLVAMLTGNIRKISASIHNPTDWKALGFKINVIKAVRSATIWGLKEAKDWVDSVEATGHGTIEISNPKVRNILMLELRKYGLTVS